MVSTFSTLELLLDEAIVAIEQKLSAQLEQVISHKAYKDLRSLWSGLHVMVEAAGTNRNVQLDLLCVAKNDLIEDFENCPDLTGSALFHHMYKTEYDQAGGTPYTSLLLQQSFGKGSADIFLLRQIAKVASACHCPTIVNASPKLFGFDDFSSLEEVRDFDQLFDDSSYTKWRNFCQDEDTRYLGMVLPGIRVGEGHIRRPPRYCKTPLLRDANQCWTYATYAFGIVLIKSFIKQGWCVYIRGPKTGGLIHEIEGCQLGVPGYHHLDPPLEIVFSDRQEQALVSQGLIPICFYRDFERLCVFSAPTMQNVSRLRSDSGQFDRLAASLPYLYLICRIAHYQKAIQRENIGLAQERGELEKELDKWLRGLITTMRDPSQEMRSERPLSGGFTKVEDDPSTPGFFRVHLVVQPHLQLEGVNAKLELSTKMPRKKE